MSYQLTTDDDGHWYVIPSDKERDWDAWLGTSAYADGDVPEWAVAVGGSPSMVTFTSYEIK